MSLILNFPFRPFLSMLRNQRRTSFYAWLRLSGSICGGPWDCHPRCSRLFVTVTELQQVVHLHTISNWICQVIWHPHQDVSKEDMCSVRVRAHEVREVATSALFKKIRSILAILRAGTWRSMSTFASFYLSNVTHRYLDTSSLGLFVCGRQGNSLILIGFSLHIFCVFSYGRLWVHCPFLVGRFGGSFLSLCLAPWAWSTSAALPRTWPLLCK